MLTGKEQKAEGSRQKAVKTERRSALRFPTAYCLLPSAYSRKAHGFTLLELMIVISILVILALIAMGQYNKTILAAKEATLRQDLDTMRKMIDQYGADKGKLPQSLSDLQSAGYIREIPIDPMTDQADWQTEFGDDPGALEGGQGITNVHSSSGDTGSDGKPYSEW